MEGGTGGVVPIIPSRVHRARGCDGGETTRNLEKQKPALSRSFAHFPGQRLHANRAHKPTKVRWLDQQVDLGKGLKTKVGGRLIPPVCWCRDRCRWFVRERIQDGPRNREAMYARVQLKRPSFGSRPEQNLRYSLTRKRSAVRVRQRPHTNPFLDRSRTFTQPPLRLLRRGSGRVWRTATSYLCSRSFAHSQMMLWMVLRPSVSEAGPGWRMISAGIS